MTGPLPGGLDRTEGGFAALLAVRCRRGPRLQHLVDVEEVLQLTQQVLGELVQVLDPVEVRVTLGHRDDLGPMIEDLGPRGEARESLS